MNWTEILLYEDALSLNNVHVNGKHTDLQTVSCMSFSQVSIQCIIGLIIGCLGVARMAGEFKEIRAAAEMANK